MQSMREIIEEAAKHAASLRKKADDYEAAIRTLQNICDHEKIEDTGHDSHHQYSQCTRCLKQFKV
jgi:hypothetical protein